MEKAAYTLESIFERMNAIASQYEHDDALPSDLWETIGYAAAAVAHGAFALSGAENFVSIRVEVEGQTFELAYRRVEGQSMGAQLDEAKGRAEKAEAEVDRLRARIKEAEARATFAASFADTTFEERGGCDVGDPAEELLAVAAILREEGE